MKRGQAFVRGRLRDGSIGNIDILDLDDASFRAFVLDRLVRAGLVTAIKDEFTDGDHVRYREREIDPPACPRMSLRDWFAGQVLASQLDDDADADLARRCYAIADALLAERQKTRGETKS